MKPLISKRLNIAIAAAVFALPLQAFINIANAAETTDAVQVTAGQRAASAAALQANDCVSLGTQRRISRSSFNRATPTLVNQCAYAVTVSYCVDDRTAGTAACEANSAKRPAAQVIPPKAAVDLQMSNSATLYEKIRWVACRSEPGITSKLNDNGTSGECLSQVSMHAEAQPTQLSR